MFFYSNEHLPKHTHVEGKGGEAKIELDSLTLIHAFNLKKNDLSTIIKTITNQRFFFIRKWDEFYQK
ncbi:DUF4160 domain-containing protein [Christiangramia sp.]|uniref:DUF4160 domain-containing protein n=1 Tax=Christiangramia sp. TaxID=1931228 RepID=UPI00345BD931